MTKLLISLRFWCGLMPLIDCQMSCGNQTIRPIPLSHWAVILPLSRSFSLPLPLSLTISFFCCLCRSIFGASSSLTKFCKSISLFVRNTHHSHWQVRGVELGMRGGGGAGGLRRCFGVYCFALSIVIAAAAAISHNFQSIFNALICFVFSPPSPLVTPLSLSLFFLLIHMICRPSSI